MIGMAVHTIYARARETAGSLPIDNVLLASLAFSDRALLAPYLRRVVLAAGDTICPAGAAIDTILLPETAIACCHEVLADGRRLAVGLIGREGLLGWPVLLGIERARQEIVIEPGGGTALALPASVLVEACRQRASLREAMLRFVHSFTEQVARTLASTLSDAVDRRVARWLLMVHDRTIGDVLDLTHERLGAALNIRRASVTGALHVLEGRQLVRCARGRVTIRDRAALEASAGACYGSAEAGYRRAIGPFGKG